MTQEFEKLGAFYLGRLFNLQQNTAEPDLLLYDSKDLTTHAVCVGMTGSGKTGLCLSLLEEAAIDGIPVIAIDPKGDLGNLMLTFPDLKPSDFRPWIEESEAIRKGMTPDEYAADRSALWRDGLAQWGQDGARIARFRDAVEVTIYTPASSAGIPLTILRSFDAPAPAVIQDAEALRDRITASASGLLALLGIDADPIRSREHILLSNVQSACAAVYGRGVRVLPACRQPTLENAPVDAVKAGTRVRTGDRVGHTESGGPRLQGTLEYGHVVSRTSADRTRQGACVGGIGGRIGLDRCPVRSPKNGGHAGRFGQSRVPDEQCAR